MKFINLLLIVLMLGACASTKPKAETGSGVDTPYWYKHPYREYSESQYILFVGKGYNFEVAKDQALRSAKRYNDYIQPKKIDEFSNSKGEIFLLYSIEKSKLTEKMKAKWDKELKNYEEAVEKGDTAGNILQKYSHYKKAMSVFDEMHKLNTLDKDIQFNLPEEMKEDHQFIIEKFNMTSSEIEFSVNVAGDIDNLIKDSIEEELHRLGYITSDNGLVQFNATLTLNDVDLENDYINKYWSITISLSDFDGYSSKSLNFKGRESQLSEGALNQSIARSVVKLVKKSLPSMLP